MGVLEGLYPAAMLLLLPSPQVSLYPQKLTRPQQKHKPHNSNNLKKYMYVVTDTYMVLNSIVEKVQWKISLFVTVAQFLSPTVDNFLCILLIWFIRFTKHVTNNQDLPLKRSSLPNHIIISDSTIYKLQWAGTIPPGCLIESTPD